jgi:hypothetical protein
MSTQIIRRVLALRHRLRAILEQASANVRAFDLPSAGAYDALVAAVLEGFYARVAGEVVAAHPGGRLLEVGSGPGWLAVRLEREAPGITVTGVDISDAMVERAAARPEPVSQRGRGLRSATSRRCRSPMGSSTGGGEHALPAPLVGPGKRADRDPPGSQARRGGTDLRSRPLAVAAGARRGPARPACDREPVRRGGSGDSPLARFGASVRPAASAAGAGGSIVRPDSPRRSCIDPGCQAQDRAPTLISELEALVSRATAYSRELLEDPPEIREWVWIP